MLHFTYFLYVSILRKIVHNPGFEDSSWGKEKEASHFGKELRANSEEHNQKDHFERVNSWFERHDKAWQDDDE